MCPFSKITKSAKSLHPTVRHFGNLCVSAAGRKLSWPRLVSCLGMSKLNHSPEVPKYPFS